MSKEIVIINGSGGVGKDAFVEFCNEFTCVKNISSVDKVKEAAKILVGWNTIGVPGDIAEEYKDYIFWCRQKKRGRL